MKYTVKRVFWSPAYEEQDAVLFAMVLDKSSVQAQIADASLWTKAGAKHRGGGEPIKRQVIVTVEVRDVK